MTKTTKNDKILKIVADLKKNLKNELLSVVTITVKDEKNNIAIVNDLVDKEKVVKALKPFEKKINVLLLSSLWQAFYDGKLSLIATILSGKIHYDNGFIKAMKAAETLKLAVIKKFERYIMSVILFGSLSRGQATEESDIDLAVIVDDTDLKNMSRSEARNRLMLMINQTAREIYPKFETVQVYLLTDVWEWIKDANPVIFTVIRDGIPLYDKGLFAPWRLLLKNGKITPSPEAIHRFQESGRLLVKMVGNEINQAVSEKLYQAMLMPAQAALMLYGVMPMTYREAPQMLRDLFVKKEKILEEKYPQWLEDIIRVRKELEHGKIKQISPEELGRQFKRAQEFQNRIDKLYEQIKKEKINDKIEEMDSDIKKAILNYFKNKGMVGGKDYLNKFIEELRNNKQKELLNFTLDWIRIIKAKELGKLTSADVQRISRDVINFINDVEKL